MPKKLFCIFLAVITLFASGMSVSAFEPSGFDVNAKTVLLASLDTGEVLYSKNSESKVYPASITAIMTATLILESDKYSPESKIVMTEEVLKLISGTGSSVSNLKAGEEITEYDLIHLVLMSAFGDCIYLAAIRYGGSVENFVAMMNAKAEELGMTGTHYSNPIGLHADDHYTTAADTLILSKYALQNETFKAVCETVKYSLTTNFTAKRTITTTNYMQDSNTAYYYIYAAGIKTGYTDEAGRCLVSTASYKGYNYICILFGCDPKGGARHEFADSKNLYRWAFNNFEFKKIADIENPVSEMPVRLSLDTDFVPLYVEKSFISVLPIEADESTITITPKLKYESVDAPVKKGDILGTAEIVYAEQLIGTVNLVAGESVKQSKLLFAVDTVKNIFSSIYMKIIYAAAAIVIIIFIIMVIRLNAGRSKKRKVKYIPYDERKENYPNGKH